jgi:tetratricopeptide (TPR) repeat protein
LAEALVKTGFLKQADRAIQAALKLSPRSAEVWVAASYVALRARNWPAAASASRRALSVDPGSVAAKNNLGVALRRGSSLALGAVAFHEAVSADPRSEAARFNMQATGFQRMGRAVPFLIFPLLIFWPLYFGVRKSLMAWLAREPEGLKPFARSLGLHLATRKRYRRRFERQNARAHKQLAAGPGRWSAVQPWYSSSAALTGAGLPLSLFGLIVCVADLGASNWSLTAKAAVAAAVFGAGTALLAVVIRRRRNM